MSAVETLTAAQAAGVRLGIEGSDLLIEAVCAPPLDLLDALRRDKLEILSLLHERETGEKVPATTVSNVLNLHGLTLADLQEATRENWLEVRDNPGALLALVNNVVTRRQCEQGERPPQWTETCECASCGPVYHWPGSPIRVPGCPWCFNSEEERRIPRPVSVICGSCRHFLRIDHPHLGHCAADEPEAIAGLWDNDPRWCTRWLPLEQNTGAEIHGQ